MTTTEFCSGCRRPILPSEDHQADGCPERLTPTQHLASLKLGRDLGEYVAEKRATGSTWQSIAADLSLDTDGVVSITREALRQWYGDAA